MQPANTAFAPRSVDLIYGLPLQTVESFNTTLDKIIELRPERISAYSYAHLPHLVRAQRLIKPEHMPPPERKLELLELTINRLCSAGYVYIGMDHFALPDDELVIARNEGTLQRNFQGYSTHARLRHHWPGLILNRQNRRYLQPKRQGAVAVLQHAA
jgi:oxygen-independent coproporphyrinogen-3 oxidase